MGLHDITWSTNTSEEEFKVVVREYDKNGKEISSITKRIGMEFIFFINDSGNKPEIRLMSCVLS